MKKIFVLFLIVMIGVSSLSAQAEADPDRNLFKVMFNTDADLSGPGSTVLAGFGIELLGYGVLLSSSMVMPSIDFGVGLGLYEGGGLGLAIGGFVVQGGLSAYHDALKAKGAVLDDKMKTNAWTFTYVASALVVSGFVMYLVSYDLLLVSVLAVGAGSLIEVINMGFGRMDWVTAMNKAAREAGLSQISVECPSLATGQGWGVKLIL